ALVEHTITADDDGRLSTSAIAGMAQFSGTAVRRALEDLQALDVVACHKAGTGKADQWTLQDRWREVFQALAEAAVGPVARWCDGGPDTSEKVSDTVSETFGGASPTDDREVFR